MNTQPNSADARGDTHILRDSRTAIVVSLAILLAVAALVIADRSDAVIATEYGTIPSIAPELVHVYLPAVMRNYTPPQTIILP